MVHKTHKKLVLWFNYFRKYLAGALRHIKTRINLRHIVLGGSAVVGVLGVAYLTQFFWPRTITFSYARETCVTNPVFLPGIVSPSEAKSYKTTMRASFSIAGYPIYSHATCVSPTKAPKPHASERSYLAPFRMPLKKRLDIRAAAAPLLQEKSRLQSPVAVYEPRFFEFNKRDDTFAYRLLANSSSAACSKQGRRISCDVSTLKLAQSAQYEFVLQRLFKGEVVGIVYKQTLPTVEAVSIHTTSIAANALVYDKPTQLSLTLNRAGASFSGSHLYLVSGDTKQEIPTATVLKDTTLIVAFKQELPRSATIVLEVANIFAADGGRLQAPFSLTFRTSGGPKVLKASIGTYKVAAADNITLTFDSAVAANQTIANFVRIEIGGTAVASAVSANGRTVVLNPLTELPRCTAFTVKVLDGLQNEAGVSGGSAWQLKSRTICQTVFSIGSSVQGRTITAYRFGTGPNKIIFVGGTHGNEKSSTYILNRWIDTLEANADRIPGNRTIIIIPNLNPDGYAANTRTNANNVDLNRNFPTSNWKQGVTMPDKSFNPNGGGSEPLSEPESRALANYILGQSPRLVLTYHASGGVVVPNGSGDSDGIARTYGQKSSVGYMPGDQTGTFFEYDTTGAFEDWLHEKHGIPALLIELLTKTSNEFNGHQNAFWYIAQLP